MTKLLIWLALVTAVQAVQWSVWENTRTQLVDQKKIEAVVAQLF